MFSIHFWKRTLSQSTGRLSVKVDEGTSGNYYHVEGPAGRSRMVLQPNNSSGNIILGTFHGTSDEHFGGGASESHYSNNNGIIEHYTASTSYVQRPDGSCVKRVVESRNGKEQIREYPMDCNEAKKEIQERSKKTHQVLSEHTKKMNEQHKKMMDEHMKTTKRLQEEIQASLSSYFKF